MTMFRTEGSFFIPYQSQFPTTHKLTCSQPNRVNLLKRMTVMMPRLAKNIEYDRMKKSELPRMPLQRYKKLKICGEGTYGIVSKAIDMVTNQYVAVKINKPGYFNVACREGAILKGFSHSISHMIPLLNRYILREGEIALVFPYKKWHLESYEDQLFREHKTMNALDIVEIAKQLFEFLSDLHKFDYLHFDIKPNNIMYAPEERKIYIIDFGLSCHKNCIKEGAAYNFRYRSPRLLLGDPHHFSDEIYTIGPVLYQQYFHRDYCRRDRNISMDENIMNLLAKYISDFGDLSYESIENAKNAKKFFKFDECSRTYSFLGHPDLQYQIEARNSDFIQLFMQRASRLHDNPLYAKALGVIVEKTMQYKPSYTPEEGLKDLFEYVPELSKRPSTSSLLLSNEVIKPNPLRSNLSCKPVLGDESSSRLLPPSQVRENRFSLPGNFFFHRKKCVIQ